MENNCLFRRGRGYINEAFGTFIKSIKCYFLTYDLQ